jgi:hypothetical protein
LTGDGCYQAVDVSSPAIRVSPRRVNLDAAPASELSPSIFCRPVGDAYFVVRVGRARPAQSPQLAQFADHVLNSHLRSRDFGG